MILKTFEQNPRRLTEEELRRLTEEVKPYLTGRRYAHTLEVAGEATRLGGIFGFSEDDVKRLRASALMHDITKLADSEKQLQYCKEFGIILEPEKNVSESVLHGITGAAAAARDFADYADADILSGIRWHTTGRYGMTVFESVIYLADYIEPTRTFDDCLSLRRYFYDRIGGCRTEEERLDVLRDTMIYSFDLTIENLLEDRRIIDSDTICARNYFIGLASGNE